MDSGIPTRIIGAILPCLGQTTKEIVVEDADIELRCLLTRERNRMTETIDILTQNRDAIARYIEAIDELVQNPERRNPACAA